MNNFGAGHITVTLCIFPLEGVKVEHFFFKNLTNETSILTDSTMLNRLVIIKFSNL